MRAGGTLSPVTQPPAPPTNPAPPKRTSPVAIIALAVIALVAVCIGGIAMFGGGDDDKDAAAASSPTGRPSTPAAASSAAPTPSPSSTGLPAGCLPVGKAVVELIDDQAKEGTGMKMTGRAAAVKSDQHVKVFMVAAEFSATGVPNQVGVWAMNSIDDLPNFLESASAGAVEFTDWLDGTKVKEPISRYDPAIQAAKACLQ